jgi:hypothetical protein
MASYLDPKRLEGFLLHILRLIYCIVEDDTIGGLQMGEPYLLFTVRSFR